MVECPELQKLEPYLSQAKGLVFDCDGTLLDTMPTYFESWTRTCKEIGLSFPMTRFYELAGMSVQHIFELLIQEQLGDDLPPDSNITPSYCEQRKKYHHEQIMKEDEELDDDSNDESSKNKKRSRRNPPIEVVFQIIHKYHTQNIPIGIASSGWKDHIIENLTKHNLLHYFTTIVTIEDEEVEKGKPHPDMYIIAAQKLGVDVKDCIGFEDADLGMDAIRNAGYMYACDVRLFYDYPRNVEQRLLMMGNDDDDDNDDKSGDDNGNDDKNNDNGDNKNDDDVIDENENKNNNDDDEVDEKKNDNDQAVDEEITVMNDTKENEVMEEAALPVETEKVKHGNNDDDQVENAEPVITDQVNDDDNNNNNNNNDDDHDINGIANEEKDVLKQEEEEPQVENTKENEAKVVLEEMNRTNNNYEQNELIDVDDDHHDDHHEGDDDKDDYDDDDDDVIAASVVQAISDEVKEIQLLEDMTTITSTTPPTEVRKDDDDNVDQTLKDNYQEDALGNNNDVVKAETDRIENNDITNKIESAEPELEPETDTPAAQNKGDEALGKEDCNEKLGDENVIDDEVNERDEPKQIDGLVENSIVEEEQHQQQHEDEEDVEKNVHMEGKLINQSNAIDQIIDENNEGVNMTNQTSAEESQQDGKDMENNDIEFSIEKKNINDNDMEEEVNEDEVINKIPSNDNAVFEKAREVAMQRMEKDKEDFFGEELPLTQKEILQSILLAEDAAINGQSDFSTMDKIHYLDRVHVPSLDEEKELEEKAKFENNEKDNPVQAIGKWFTSRFNRGGNNKKNDESTSAKTEGNVVSNSSAHSASSPTNSQASSFL